LQWLEECFELCGRPIELMSDNGQPFVFWMPGVLTLFGKRLRDLRIRHFRTQISSPWTNGKIEAFWEILQAEVLDRKRFASFTEYYNYHACLAYWGGSRRLSATTGPPLQTEAFRTYLP